MGPLLLAERTVQSSVLELWSIALEMIATDAPPQSGGKRSSSNKVHVENHSKRVAEQRLGVFSSWRATRRFDQVLLVDLKRVKGEDLTASVVLTLDSIAAVIVLKFSSTSSPLQHVARQQLAA
jgi:hypothetical protein